MLNEIASFLSAGGTIGAFWVSYRLYRLQREVERSRSSKVSFWFEANPHFGGEMVGTLVFVNLGGAALPIKKIDIPNDRGLDYRFNFSGAAAKVFIFKPNEPQHLAIVSSGNTYTQFAVRFQFFDGEIRTVHVDTAILGPYQIEQSR